MVNTHLWEVMTGIIMGAYKVLDYRVQGFLRVSSFSSSWATCIHMTEGV